MLIMSVLNLIAGYMTVECSAEDAVFAVNVMMSHGIENWNLERENDGRLRFDILEREFKKLKQVSYGINFSVVGSHGLPGLFRRYKRRIGIPVGLLIMLILVKLSTMFIWDVTVSGNDTVSDAEIIGSLEKLGCSVGTYIPGVDFYDLCHEFLLENGKLAWVSVNMVGTTARVEVIERTEKKDDDNNGTPSNLIACRDGVIVSYQTSSGQTEVKVGQTVSEGQLLVGGVVVTGQEDSGFVIVRSRGEVYAQTKRNFSVEVPFEMTVKEYIGRKNVSKSLKFFGKMIKLKEKCSILPDGCDIIEQTDRLILFEGSKITGGISLPISIVTGFYEEYTEKKVRYTEEEALEIAEKEMAELISHELSGAEILSVEKESTTAADILVLDVTAECIENIAVEVPIGLE